MTQFGLKNWAEVTQIKCNQLWKQCDARIQDILIKYRKFPDQTLNPWDANYGKDTFTDPKKEQELLNLRFEIANRILPTMRYCGKIMQRPESVDGKRD
jgi:hypothetical protein